MRVCFVGDVVGSAGRRAFKTVMPSFLKSNKVDCCIVNAENSVHGLGASINMLRDLVSWTYGNDSILLEADFSDYTYKIDIHSDRIRQNTVAG